MSPKKTEEKERLVILDTHAILHRAYHALPDFSSSKGEPTGALYGLISMLVKLITDLQPDYVVAAFDLPGPTYRHAAFEKYKAQRKDLDDALAMQIERSRAVLKALGIPLYECKGFEADDVIGTIVEKLSKRNDLELVVASGDMDTLQLVGGNVRAYTLRKGLTDTVLYDEARVKERYGFGPEQIPDFKGLRGDPSDNIPGIKGVGEKTATTLIAEFGSVENLFTVLKKNPAALEAVGVKGAMLAKLQGGEEDAKFSKMLATIHHDVPIDFMLPKPWREEISQSDAIDMLHHFDFRSLIPRVKGLLDPAQQLPSEKVLGSPVSPEAARGPDHFLQEAPATDQLFPSNIPQDEIDRVGLAVYVLDSNITQPTLDDIYRVGKSDDFEEAKKTILNEVKERGLSYVYETIELPLYPVLRAMERRGVKVDKKFLSELSKKYTKELKEIAERIYAAAGEEFNINSPKQLGNILFDKLGLAAKNQKKTATGARSTRESELEKLRDSHPIIADILAYRELNKLLSTYIDTIPTLLDANDRVHTTYIQTGAATGRIASQNPNLQNIPIKTEQGRAIRHAFVASEGMQLLSFDYSQIELRIAAFLSNDEGLTEIFKAGRDVHREVAARIFKVEPEAVTYEQRRRAKVINFGILYGMGVNALQQGLGTSRGEAQEFYDQYFSTFPRLAAYLNETKADASRTGYTETFFGRRRYLEGIRSPIPYVRAAAERMALNAPIQGTQADVVKLAMVEIASWIEKEKLGDIYMLLQVHDELVFEVASDKIETYAPKICDMMEQVVPEEKRRGIPFSAEGKAGKDWGEMEELKL